MAGSSGQKKYRISPVEGVEAPRSAIEEFLPDAGVAALRVAIGLMLVLHGLQEHFGILLPVSESWRGAPGMFTDRWIAASLELVGGLLLAAGAFSRWVSLGMALFIALSYFAPARMQGHWMFGSAELIAIYTGVLIAIALTGPGIFSLDALRAGRFRARPHSMAVSMSPWIRKQYRRQELTR